MAKTKNEEKTACKNNWGIPACFFSVAVRGTLCCCAVTIVLTSLLSSTTLDTTAAYKERDLRSATKVKLSASDFKRGTYRITKPGKYSLTEDIEFEPNVEHDYWPTFDQWKDYPPSKFYLGFFAAITIEADDVTIDLGGHTIRQSPAFYLAQRFFNVIELNDRVFIDNTGVQPLNYQKTDQVIPGSTFAGSVIKPKNIVIKNGILGRSSHNGIHGNGINGLVVKDIVVEDFEVAGIQCNGCKNVQVRKTNIGPSSRSVPALATFSSARFIQFFTQRLIPFGFAQEPMSEELLSLFETTISFSDREGELFTLREIFEKVDKAVKLFSLYGNLPAANTSELLTPKDLILFEEARAVFGNPWGLTDGSVQYGIFFGREGMPNQDDNFNGAGKEAASISVSKVSIKGLHANPLEVPSLVTEEGAHIQGPARDVLRISEITTDELRTLSDSRYKGNFLSDAYFALWKLSNDFYNIRVFDSQCGNFGSNATFPYNLAGYPSGAEPTCAEFGSRQDPMLTGREIVLLQKRYFGGLQMSQGVYDWATNVGVGLDVLMASPPSADELRSGGRHRLVCGHDTMFHENQGVIGIKLVEAADVTIRDVHVEDLKNGADLARWECTTKWQLQPSGEDIEAISISADTSSVKGIQTIRSENINFSDVTLSHLSSDEGAVVGIDVIGDDNDRTDHMDDSGIRFEKVHISDLDAAGSTRAIDFFASPLVMPSGITSDGPEEIDASLGSPRAIFHYKLLIALPIPEGQMTSEFLIIGQQGIIEAMKRTTSFDTEEKILKFRAKVLAYFEMQYGFRYTANVHSTPLLAPIVLLDEEGSFTDTVILFAQYNPDLQYHGTSLCVSTGDGSKSQCSPRSIYPVNDFVFITVVGPSGYTLKGSFGSDAGQFATGGNIILAGVYSFEGVELDGVNKDKNFEVEYFGECPIQPMPVSSNTVAQYINCALESTLFGKGHTVGGIKVVNNGTHEIYEAYPTMFFDDQVINPVPSIAKSNEYDEDAIRDFNVNDWQFTIVADGLLPLSVSQKESMPFSNGFFFTHEAALHFFKFRTTSLQTDQDILALRKSFMARLRSRYGIDVDPDGFDDIPLDGEIDLGGGNQILAYVVNEAVKMRVLSKMSDNGSVDVMPPGARLHEGGFVLRVGRAGIDTFAGRVPFGTLYKNGVYILEDPLELQEEEIFFQDDLPIFLDGWSTSVVYQTVESPKYGKGVLLAANPLVMDDNDNAGLRIRYRGSMLFGNTDLGNLSIEF